MNLTEIQQGIDQYRFDSKTFFMYHTLHIYDTYYIDTLIKKGMELNKILIIHGQQIKLSQRYKLFTRDRQVCVSCGLQSTFWALQRDKKKQLKIRYHLNLYGIDKQNNIVLFTKDHIIPKSKGGADSLSNYQVMCQRCNTSKGNTMPITEPQPILIEGTI